MGFTPTVTRIEDGQSVSASVINTPIVELNNNDAYLKTTLEAVLSTIDAITTGAAVIKTGLAMKSDVSAGNAVYWNSANSRYENALADGSASGNFVGFCALKSSSTIGALATAGYVVLAPVLAGVETIQAGVYWLSQAEAGKITATKPTAGSIKAVALADGAGNLIVINDDRSTERTGSVDTGTSANSYASVKDTGAVTKGVFFLATLKNTDAANTLTAKLDATDVFGITTSLEEDVPPGCAAKYCSTDTIDNLNAPYSRLIVSVKSTTGGLAATYSIGWMQIGS